MLQEIKQYTNLQHVASRITQLSLKNNRLSSIQKDSKLLKKIRTLDLSGNPFDSISSVLESLLNMPVLRELNIDIQSPEEESLLIQALPKLTVLNGRRLGESDDRPNRPDMREEGE